MVDFRLNDYKKDRQTKSWVYELHSMHAELKMYRVFRDIVGDLNLKCGFINDLASAIIYQHFKTCTVCTSM